MKTISKRWIKNAVAIVVMLALCGSMVFTMNYAKSHAQASDMPQMSQGSDSSGGPGGGGTPPDQSGFSDSNSQSGDQQNTQDSSDQQSGQPPAKPEDSGIADSPKTAPTCRKVHQIKAATFLPSTTSSLVQKVFCWHWH